MLEGATRAWSVSMPVLVDGEPSFDFWLRNQCIQQFQSGPWSLPVADIMFDAIPASGVEEGARKTNPACTVENRVRDSILQDAMHLLPRS